VWDEWVEEESLIDVAYEEPSQSASSAANFPTTAAASNAAEEALPPRKIVEIQRSPESQDRSGTVYSFSYRRDQLSVDDTRPDASTPAPPATDSDDSGSVSQENAKIDGSPQAAQPTPPAEDQPIRIIIPPYTAPSPSSPSSPTVLQPTSPDELPSGSSKGSSNLSDEPDDDEVFGASPFQLGDDVDAFESHPDRDGDDLEEGSWLNDEPASAASDARVSQEGDKEVWDDWDDEWDDDDDDTDPPPPQQGNPPLRL
jgi:hypothetical protein